jgi:hypothetical protein
MDKDIKLCGGCKILKPFSHFNKNKRGRFGLHNHCKSCQKECKAKYYAKNRKEEIRKANDWSKTEKAKISRKKRYENRREELLEINRRIRKTPSARAAARKNQNERYHTDMNYRLAKNLRTRVRVALRGIAKSAKTKELLGCSFKELKIYIESKFEEGMSWENYGYDGWHIDHIKPCAAFNLVDPEEQKQCFHYSNLKPLWAFENISKNSNYEGDRHLYKKEKINE